MTIMIFILILICIVNLISFSFANIENADKFKPEQIHLTFHSNPNKLVVTWTSFELIPFSTIIEYGSSSHPHQLTNKNEGTFLLYENDLCRNSTRAIHTVEFDIQEGEQVFYRLSGDNGLTFSDVYNTTGQKRSYPQTAALWGDMGVNCQQPAVPRIIEDAVAGIHSYALHYGDTAYNMDEDCGRVGDYFLNAVMPYSTLLPIVYTNGNHEGGPYKRYHEYIKRLADGQNDLANASQSFNNRYFMFSVGPVTYIAIDPDAWIYPPVFNLAQPQYDWLQKVLPTVNRTSTPWLVVLSHRALYCTKTVDRECNQEAEILRNGLFPLTPKHQRYGLEDLFLEYGVDFVFSGHTHHYERTYPVKKSVATQHDYLNPRGIIHIQSGIAGIDDHDPFDVPQEDWESFRDTSFTHSYSRITFHDDFRATVQQLRNSDGSVLDEFTVVQNKHGSFL